VAVDNLDSTAVGAFDSPNYGTVTLTQDGTRVDLQVDLRADLNFVTTRNAGRSPTSVCLPRAAIRTRTSRPMCTRAPPVRPAASAQRAWRRPCPSRRLVRWCSPA